MSGTKSNKQIMQEIEDKLREAGYDIEAMTMSALGGNVDTTAKEATELLESYDSDPFRFLAAGTEARRRFAYNVADKLVKEYYSLSAEVFAATADDIHSRKEEAFLLSAEVLSDVVSEMEQIALSNISFAKERNGGLS